MNCTVCGTKKATQECGLCAAATCKGCTEKLSPTDFLFMTPKPAKLSHTSYCHRCFDEHVAGPKQNYENFVEQAKETYYLSRDYRGNVRILRKHTKRVSVSNYENRREMIMSMAYQAAVLGFNAIILAEIDNKKIRDANGYQSTRWSGSSLPATVDGERLELSSLKGF